VLIFPRPQYSLVSSTEKPNVSTQAQMRMTTWIISSTNLLSASRRTSILDSVESDMKVTQSRTPRELSVDRCTPAESFGFESLAAAAGVAAVLRPSATRSSQSTVSVRTITTACVSDLSACDTAKLPVTDRDPEVTSQSTLLLIVPAVSCSGRWSAVDGTPRLAVTDCDCRWMVWDGRRWLASVTWWSVDEWHSNEVVAAAAQNKQFKKL